MNYFRCKVHKAYKAKRKPRVLCDGCWLLWVGERTDVQWEYCIPEGYEYVEKHLEANLGRTSI